MTFATAINIVITVNTINITITTVDANNPALPWVPDTLETMVLQYIRVMQDF